MNRPDLPIDTAIDAYIDGHATPEQAQALEAWIQADEQNAANFLKRVYLHQQIGERLRKARLGKKLAISDNSDARSSDSSIFAAEVLEALKQIEAESDQAPAINADQWLSTHQADHRKASTKPSYQDFASAAGYIARHTLTPRLLVGGAIAAVLLIGAAVFIALYNPGETQQELVTLPDHQPAIEPRVVATLTAEHNTQWGGPASAAPATGDALRSGQRFTLTSGFAEITTVRGAVVILEAPATVELLDSDNAIRLHGGKLLGIVESDRAKGFVVRAPHMDVTDLGTRFGIDATNAGATEVHVLQGRVAATRFASAGAESAREMLQEGDAVVARVGQPGLASIANDPARFALIDPRTIPLRGTGQGLAVGERDPDWQVIAVNGHRLETPVSMRVERKLRAKGWGTSRGETAATYWLGDATAYEQRTGHDETTLTCLTRLELPADAGADQAALRITFAADDRITQIRINGKPFTPPSNSYTDTGDAPHTMRIRGALRAGLNTVEIDVIDVARNNSTLWGFALQWHLEAGVAAAP